MPRIQMTRTVKAALMLLRVYLVAMLVLILVGFWRHRSSLRSVVYSAATQAAATHPAAGTAER